MENNTTWEEKVRSFVKRGDFTKLGGGVDDDMLIAFLKSFMADQLAAARAEERQKIVLKGERNRLIIQLREEGRAEALAQVKAIVPELKQSPTEKKLPYNFVNGFHQCRMAIFHDLTTLAVRKEGEMEGSWKGYDVGHATALKEAMTAVKALPDTAPDRESDEYDAGCRDMKVRVLATLSTKTKDQ